MSEKIRILHVIKTLGLGGAEVNLLNLVQATDINRFELHAAYSSGGELEEKFKKAGVKLFKFAGQDHKVKSLATFGIIMRLANYLLHNHIDIIHTHTFSAQLWGAAAAKLAGCKIIEHVHDFRYMESEDFARRRGFNNQYKYVHNFRNVSDRVVVLTRQNKEFLIKEKIYPLDRIREYQNGIPLDGFSTQVNSRQEVINNFKLPSEALIILTPIRIAPEKNADLILRIAPQVIRQLPNAFFLIAGDGPLYQKTLGEIKIMGLENNIKLIGYHSNIQFLLKSTDVFLLPSFLELHSIAILEAMSMKVPVVISKEVGCNSEFIDDWQNGVLLDPFKDEGWAEAIIGFLKSPQLRQQVGDKGYQTCLEKFNIKDAARRFEDLYVELTNV
jgi:glycosyltransferase involved in cell wall biosynthesis